MKILVVEPYFTGSHAAWAEGYKNASGHDVEILKLSGNYWKWRMHGGAVTLARRFLETQRDPDVILVSDMLDLTTFQALTRARTAGTTTAIYFHENQLSYPWSPTDRDVTHKRDKHYGFINYVTAMAADAVFFNSRYHLESFFEELERLLKHFPDHNELGSIDAIRQKSSVLHLGMDLGRFDKHDEGALGEDHGGPQLILWNHRWEYDKNPEEFFRVLGVLVDRGLDFRLAVLGENFSQIPEVFLKARQALGDRVVQFGYEEDPGSYARWLYRANLLPVTSCQDFFGTSVVEAVYCGCRPLLPRRLAYPELIPEKYFSEVFYDDFDDLAARLEQLLRKETWEPITKLAKTMARFDWSIMAPIYDGALENIS